MRHGNFLDESSLVHVHKVLPKLLPSLAKAEYQVIFACSVLHATASTTHLPTKTTSLNASAGTICTKPFCLAPDFLKTIAMPRATQNKGFGPKPVEINNTAAKHNPVQGTSKNDQELLHDLLGFLDQRIQNETNPRRRESIELCQDFVKEHGYPEENYYIYAWATHGIVRVLNEDDLKTLPNTIEHARERYTLVSWNKPNLSCSST